MPISSPSQGTPRPIRSTREVVEERVSQMYGQAPYQKPTEEERKRSAELARINALPRRERRKARRIMYRTTYDVAKLKFHLLRDIYSFNSKEEYYAKYAYSAAAKAIKNHPEVPQVEKDRTARWDQLPFYTRDAYIELIRMTFALRDDLRTKEKKLWAAQRHIL